MSTYAGIDVSKTTLDVAITTSNSVKQFPQTPEGIKELTIYLKQSQVTLTVLEATAGYEFEVMVAMSEAGCPFALIQPARIRYFAKAMGIEAKTDKLDAKVLASYANAKNPSPTKLPSEESQHLASLLGRRRQILDLITVENNHLESAKVIAKPSIERILKHLQGEFEVIEKEIQQYFSKCEAKFQEKVKNLESIPGIGRIGSLTLVAELPEIGQLNHRQLSALAGLAPFNRDSGKSSAKRFIRGGRQSVRNVLYMCALSAIRRNLLIKAFYEQLRSGGKPFKLAMVAAMRKLLTFANALLRDGTEWNPRLQEKEVAA